MGATKDVALVRQYSSDSGKKMIEDVTVITGKVFAERELPLRSFEVGVLNVLAVSLIFGAAPHYLWLYSMWSFPVLLLLVVKKWTAEGKLLYLAEFCWIVNTIGWLFLAVEGLHISPLLASHDRVLWMTEGMRLTAARGFFAIANGPLSVAILLNKNAVVFHDVERTAGFFIHFTPALVSYTMRWRFERCTPADVATASLLNKAGGLLARLGNMRPSAPVQVPGACPVERLLALDVRSEHELDTPGELFFTPLSMYLAWWVCYGVWLVAIGHALPGRGWGGSSFKDMQPMIMKLFCVPETSPRKQACAYLLTHGVMVTLIFLVLPRLLYRHFALHTAWLLLLLVTAVHNGARYYQYSFGKKLAKDLKIALDEELIKQD